MRKFKIGDICKVKDPRSCRNFEGSKAKYIRIEGFVGNFRYRYVFLDSSFRSHGQFCDCFDDSHLTLYRTHKAVEVRDAKYGVNWMEDEDPTEFFASEAQAKKRIEELLKDDAVQKDSIYMFTIGEVHKVEVPTAYKLVRLAKRLVGRPRKSA